MSSLSLSPPCLPLTALALALAALALTAIALAPTALAQPLAKLEVASSKMLIHAFCLLERPIDLPIARQNWIHVPPREAFSTSSLTEIRFVPHQPWPTTFELMTRKALQVSRETRCTVALARP